MGGYPNASLTRTFPGEEHHQLALMQLLKVHGIRANRTWHNEPAHGYHVASRFNPIQPELTNSTIAYRPPLQVSIWSEPQIIIDSWARDNAFSVGLKDLRKKKRHFHPVLLGLMGEGDDFNAFGRILRPELKNKFGLAYSPQ